MVGVQADRLYVGDTLVWDASASGGGLEVEVEVSAGVGELAIPVMAVTSVGGDAPVRVRLYNSEEGRDDDLSRSIFSRYPGSRCLALEVNAPRPQRPVTLPLAPWSYGLHAFIHGPTVYWSADGPAVITLTGRLL